MEHRLFVSAEGYDIKSRDIHIQTVLTLTDDEFYSPIMLEIIKNRIVSFRGDIIQKFICVSKL